MFIFLSSHRSHVNTKPRFLLASIMILILVGSVANSNLFPTSATTQPHSPLSRTTTANELIETLQDANTESSVPGLEIGNNQSSSISNDTASIPKGSPPTLTTVNESKIGNATIVGSPYNVTFPLINEPPPYFPEYYQRQMEEKEGEEVEPSLQHKLNVSENALGAKLEFQNYTLDTIGVIGPNQSDENVLQLFSGDIPPPPGSDPPGDFRVFKYVGGNDIFRLPTSYPNVPFTEPSLATNGRTIMYVGGPPAFIRISPNAGNSWYSFDPLFDGDLTFSSNRVPCDANLRDQNGNTIRSDRNCAPNITGDSDVIYTPFGGGKFIWYRQGVDGRLSLGISPDAGLRSWRFIPPFGIEDLVAGASETIRSQWSLPTRCQGPANPNDPNQRYVNAYWWDFPQLALSNRYLYLSTDILLGCTTDPRVWTDPDNANYVNEERGAIIMRLSLNDLSSGTSSLPAQYYFSDSNSEYNLALTQGVTDTMYWGTHVPQSDTNPNVYQMRLCKWNDDGAPSNIQCVLQDVDPFRRTGGMVCRGPDNRNYCAAGTPHFIQSGWFYGNEIGFFWNVGEDRSMGGVHPYPWVASARFSAGNDFGTRLPDTSSLSSENYALMNAFSSPNVSHQGVAIAAWYGGGNSRPGVMLGIKDRYNADVTDPYWQRLYAVSLPPSCLATEDPARSSIGFCSSERFVYSTSATPAQSDVRWGDYLRVRPFGNYGNLWAASAYILTGERTNPNIDHLFIVFGRDADRENYDALSQGLPQETGAEMPINNTIDLQPRCDPINPDPNNPECKGFIDCIKYPTLPPCPHPNNKNLTGLTSEEKASEPL